MEQVVRRRLGAYTALSVLTPPVLGWSQALCVRGPGPRLWWLLQLGVAPLFALPCLLAVAVAALLQVHPRDSRQRNPVPVVGMLAATYLVILLAHIGMLVGYCRNPDGYAAFLAIYSVPVACVVGGSVYIAGQLFLVIARVVRPRRSE
jgi:hypothetical protein